MSKTIDRNNCNFFTGFASKLLTKINDNVTGLSSNDESFIEANRSDQKEIFMTRTNRKLITHKRFFICINRNFYGESISEKGKKIKLILWVVALFGMRKENKRKPIKELTDRE